MADPVHSADASAPIVLSRGVPPREAIPSETLARIAKAVVSRNAEAAFQYAPLGGFLGAPGLRRRLGAFHGANPDGIFVSNGSLQVLDLVAALLLSDEQRTVLVERPTYDRSIRIFERHGGRIVGVPLRNDGPDLDLMATHLKERSTAFIYLIPDFQNPSGVTASLSKRRRILELAHEHDVPVVEDIPYRALRFAGEAPPLFRAIAGDADVVTIGSLSKVLCPGVRIGYAITNPSVASRLAELAENTYLSPAPLCQALAEESFAQGLVDENIVRVRDLLRPRCAAATACARSLLGDRLLAEPEGGYFLSAVFDVAWEEREFIASARDAGVALTPGSAFFPPGEAPLSGQIFVRLPFHAVMPEAFEAAVRRLVALAERSNGGRSVHR